MAHLKMDMLLTETGYKPSDDQRFKIFLTNSLEEADQDSGTLFSSWLSDESNQANEIKRDTPVMCVIGNPPYSVSSTNKSPWIEGLTADYKKDMKERNIQPLSDDYIKFIRYGQHFIDKNGEGILAYISNNSFIDGIIHRQMRKHLLESFDKIYILDLHGNAKKREVCPDGSQDQNVFDIMQGVSINVFVKTGKKKQNELGQILHFDLYGKRDFKYDFLTQNSLTTFKWNELEFQKPDYFFVNKNFEGENDYVKGFKLDELFNVYSMGIKTARDGLTINFDKNKLYEKVKIFADVSEAEAKSIFNLPEDSRDWKINLAQKDVCSSDVNIQKVQKITYRAFDDRYTYYTGKTKGFMESPRYDVFKHIVGKDNFCLITNRQIKIDNISHFFITKHLSDLHVIETANANPNHFPLYLYPNEIGQQNAFGTSERVPNLNMEIIKQIATGLGLTFTNEKEETPNTFAPIDLLDYIYAVLHSPTYREKYKEFLKIDFPRVPAPLDHETFWKLAKLGGELRQIHLLESPIVEKYITGYPEDGGNVVNKPTYKNGHVYINDTQYFSNVPEVAWNFYIGGYQPLQKWLKDRRERELSTEDIFHYQKIIVALSETDRIMKEIDKIEIC
jgi:predicted helicase